MCWRAWGCALGIAVLAASVKAEPFIPNDPYFPISWHASQVGLPEAWSYSRGSSDVIVAVLDTGTIATEPELQGRVLPTLSVLDDAYSDERANRHGTWVASVLGMGINNGIGGVGVGQFSILPIKTVSGNATTPEWIAEGIRLAADNGAKVINVSLQSLTYGQLDQAAAYARSKGALTFVAAGNSNSFNPMTGFNNLIFVSGTDEQDQRWVTSANVGSSWGPYVDLSAPAVDMLVADSIDPNLNGYGLIDGTSFAAPLAAGAAALAWSINPELTPDQVQSMLYTTAVDLGDPGWDQLYGWGRIDIGAVAAAAAATVPEPGSLMIVGLVGTALLLRPRKQK
ncbi:MAG TPA: S8 family serine peptidase [Tepidisphaeraceae bacterium]|nr:S8 family serine peptidase [Tepidisphaeraceae bacterium]